MFHVVRTDKEIYSLKERKLPKDFYHLKRDNNPLREDAFTLSCLGKVQPASSSDFLRCRAYLSTLINGSTVENEIDHQVLIIGLTESGIIPALLMYIETLERNLDASILYSTRRPLSGIAFKEIHSHGPDHILPLEKSGRFINCKGGEKIEASSFKEIWIVEDEITSGNTVYNLMVQLCGYFEISRVRVFAFADFRDSEKKSDFDLKTSMNNIYCTVHTLDSISEDAISSNSIKPNGYFSNTNSHKADIKNNRSKLFNSIQNCACNGWHLPLKRPAITMQSGNFIDSTISNLPYHKLSSEWISAQAAPNRRRTILAVGEAIDLAACFALSDEHIRFQQISLSPWQIDNSSIFSRISFADRYYLYNYEQLKNSDLYPIFILCDPIDKQIEQEAILKLGEFGIEIKPIFEPIELY